MDQKERLYLGLGIMAFAVAKSDGEINKEESDKLHEIVSNNQIFKDSDIDISTISFSVLEKFNGFDQEELYQLAIKEINLGKDYLTEDMRVDFPAVVEKVARAFYPYTDEEHYLVERFREDVANL